MAPRHYLWSDSEGSKQRLQTSVKGWECSSKFLKWSQLMGVYFSLSLPHYRLNEFIFNPYLLSPLRMRYISLNRRALLYSTGVPFIKFWTFSCYCASGCPSMNSFLSLNFFNSFTALSNTFPDINKVWPFLPFLNKNAYEEQIVEPQIGSRTEIIIRSRI